jgi:sterol desaturase/sphingolipid hydroxylase (fatty acid hydroxylase superfamily)
MDTKYIALATPVFMLLVVIELLVLRARGGPAYRLHAAVSNIACGIGEQAVLLFTGGLGFAIYGWVHQHAPLHLGAPSALGWVLVFVGVDLGYYWFHRTSHRVSFMWAGHAVHHQSEDYNLSAALRQNWVENLLALPFYLPLALLGFPPLMYVTASTLNSLYQFWIHTPVVRSCGPIEGWLNTPASHRVHHGVNPRYIDKNFGGVFTFWDRVFATYQREDETPVYGTVTPIASWSPLWANLAGWAKLMQLSAKTARPADKLRLWVARPDWFPADLGGPVTAPEVDLATYRKFETATPSGVDAYVFVQFLAVMGVTLGLMWFDAVLPRGLALGAVAWVLVSLVAFGGLFEGKPWARPLEVARWGVGAPLAWLAVTQLS